MNAYQKLLLRKNLVMGVFLLCCVFSAFFLSLIPPIYTATAVINFTPTPQNINTLKTTANLRPLSTTFKDEETFIRSEKILFGVIEKLNLSQQPEINPEKDPHQSKLYMLQKYISALQNIQMPPYEDNSYIQTYINENLKITIKNATEIHLTFSSASPYLSRAITNTIADFYMKEKSANGTKTLLSKTKELPEHSFDPIFYSALYAALLISFLISIMIAITTPLHHTRVVNYAS